jgi:hypothetical protein
MNPLSSVPILYLFFTDSFWSATTFVEGQIHFFEIGGRTLFPLSFLAQGTVIESRFVHQIEDFERESGVFYDNFFINIAKKSSFQVLSRQFPYVHLLKTDLAQVKQQYLQKYNLSDKIPIQILHHISLDKFPQDFFNFLTENGFEQDDRVPKMALRYLPESPTLQSYVVVESLEKNEKKDIFLHHFQTQKYEKIPLQQSFDQTEALTKEILRHLQIINQNNEIEKLYLVGDAFKKQQYLYETFYNTLGNDKFSFLNTREAIALQVSNLAKKTATKDLPAIPSPFETPNEAKTEIFTSEDLAPHNPPHLSALPSSETRAFFSSDWEKLAPHIIQFENKILQKSYQKAIKEQGWLHQEVVPYLKTQGFELLESYDFAKYYISEHYYADSTLSDAEFMELQAHLRQWQIEDSDIAAALKTLNIKPNIALQSQPKILEKTREETLDAEKTAKKYSKTLIWVVLSGVIFLVVALGGFWLWKKYQPTSQVSQTAAVGEKENEDKIEPHSNGKGWEKSLIGTYQGKAYNRLTNELSFVRLTILEVESPINGKMNCTFTIENSAPQKGEIDLQGRTISFLLEPANRYELGVYQISEATGRISLKSLAQSESILEKLK